MWKNDDFFFSDSPTKKNSKTTCVLHRDMRSSALYAQVICAHMCRLRHLSTTNGLGAMERRSKKNRFFKKYMLAQKTYFPTSIQKVLWHDYGRYLDTSKYVKQNLPKCRGKMLGPKNWKMRGKNLPGKLLVTPLGPETTLLASTRRAGPDKKNRK